MGRPLRVLIIEDSEDDTLLLLQELRRGGYEPVYKRVETPEQLTTALKRQAWDVVLADYTMPQLNVPTALCLLKESGFDLPFIIVSGTIDEEAAVASLKAGAHDFVVKNKMARLIPAIERELREAAGRRERKRAEEETRLLQRMAFAVSDAEDFHSGLGVALRQVCEATGWICGEAWVPNSDGTVLECSSAWHVSVEGLEEFRRSSENMTFHMGEGLPGRAWSLKKPVWKTDVTVENGFVRTPLAREYGLKAGVAIPVVADDEAVAIMAFFVTEKKEEDERLIGLVSTVATQLGSLMRRKQAEDALGKAHEELKQAYERLEQAQATAISQEKLAAVGRLTAGVSHEILNPLNVIIMNLHMMLSDSEISSEMAEDLRTMEEQAKRIVKISQELLYFSRQREPVRRKLDLNETVRRTLSLLGHDLRLNNIAVELKLDEELPTVFADQDQISQVILNLLTNAQDALSGGGRITVKTTEAQPLFEGSRVLELRVEDTGPGINTEHVDKLFDPFFTTKPEGKGTGLGLSICHGIVEGHGGSIWAENLPEGGAAFIVRLPVEPIEENIAD